MILEIFYWIWEKIKKKTKKLPVQRFFFGEMEKF